LREVQGVLDMNENRRVRDRRKHPRRTHDLLQGVVSEEDLQQYDRQLCGRKIDVDRHAQERRSGEDRRADSLRLQFTIPPDGKQSKIEFLAGSEHWHMKKELACPCEIPNCELRGDCVECFKNHTIVEEVLSCMRPGNTTPKEVKQRVFSRLQDAGLLDYGNFMR